jgi:hypothetical protein
VGRAARATGAGARPLCRGPAGFGGALPIGHGARQAARCARKTAVRRAASLGRRLLGGSTLSGRLDEAREYRLASKREWSSSRRSRSKMRRRSRCAAYWRPFLAPRLVRREPSVWVSGSGPSMPSSHARFGLAAPNPALASGPSQAIVMLHAGAPTCRSRRHVPLPVRSHAVLPSLRISRRLLRPQSPFPRLSEIWHV